MGMKRCKYWITLTESISSIISLLLLLLLFFGGCVRSGIALNGFFSSLSKGLISDAGAIQSLKTPCPREGRITESLLCDVQLHLPSDLRLGSDGLIMPVDLQVKLLEFRLTVFTMRPTHTSSPFSLTLFIHPLNIRALFTPFESI